MPTKPVIGIYVQRFPVPSETFIVTKVLGLLAAGFDVRIFAAAPSDHWGRFAALNGDVGDDVRQRLHIAPPTRPLSKMLTRGIAQVLRTALVHPLDFGRLMLHSWRTRHDSTQGFLRGVYSRVNFVGHRVDVLHVEFDAQGVNIADMKDYLHCRLLLSARGTFQMTTVPDWFPGVFDYLFRYVDGYHFIGDFLRENTRRLGLPNDVPTWLIYPAVDLQLFRADNPRQPHDPNAPLKILSVGRLAWAKGYEFALDTVLRLRQRGLDVRYTVLGEGPYLDALTFAANQLGITDIVTFVGAVPREKVIAYYQDADVLLHLALEEGFCNAVIESQAMGLPVVCSDVGGLPENIADGVTGFLVPQRDPDAAADKLIELAHNPELALKMGAAGRERSFAHYDLSEQIERFTLLYLELAALPVRKSQP
ncbi:MAG: glycosyltransferase family 4 protein [Burkholderiales bacterium]|nr:glycosyltransferase family 4 protein [Anaerolineae bacterium]